MTGPDTIFDTALLKRRKERVAQSGAALPDFLLHHTAGDIAERLEIMQRNFPMAACFGALHGILGRRIRAVASVGRVADVESSERLLARCDGPRVLGDDEAIPFAEASLDLAVSALTLHLANDLPGTLAQIRRSLKPDGLFLASMLGGDTLRELREAWLVAESDIAGGASPRVAPFADVRDLGALLQRAGFALPVADSERLTVTYANPLALMREIKAMGASNMLAQRRRKPVPRRLLFRAAEVYSEKFAQPGGRITATFEILTLTAWAPHECQQKPLRPGSAQSRLADILGVAEHTLPNRGMRDPPKG